jgi:hypothetical protein
MRSALRTEVLQLFGNELVRWPHAHSTLDYWPVQVAPI